MINYSDFDFVTFCQVLDKKLVYYKDFNPYTTNGFISIHPTNTEFDTLFILNIAKKKMFIPESRRLHLQRAFLSFCKREWHNNDCTPDMFNIFKDCYITTDILKTLNIQSNVFVNIFLQKFIEQCYSGVYDSRIYDALYNCKKDNYEGFKIIFDYMCKKITRTIQHDDIEHVMFWHHINPFLKYENNFNYILNKCPNFMLKDLLQYAIDNDCTNYIDTMLELPSFENILKSIKIITISPSMFDILFVKYDKKYFNDLHILKTMENCNHDYNMLFRLSMLNIFNMLEQPINSEWPNDDSSYIVKDKLLEVYEQDIKYKEHVIFLKN